jgi:arginyl-tRNA synthetase
VLEALKKGILYRKEDNSVWADLTDSGLDHKVLLRSDGTSVYMTQDIGTAVQRFNEFPISQLIYVVGNEQNYHFRLWPLSLRAGIFVGQKPSSSVVWHGRAS